MAAIYKPGVLTIIPHYDIGAGHDVVNVMHFLGQTISYDVSQLTAIQTTFDTSWGTSYRAFLPTTNLYKGCIVIDSGSAFGQEKDNSAFAAQPGNAVAGPIADNAAVLLSLHVLQRYKGGHGRAYLPGFSLDMIEPDGRNVLPTTLAAVESMWQNLRIAMAGNGTNNGGPHVPVLWHKKWAAAPNSTSEIVGATTSAVLATQRRRLRKVSRHKKKTP